MVVAIKVLEAAMLKISFYDGQYTGDAASPTKLCDVEGSAVPFDRPPFFLLEEVFHVLEHCTDKYSTPCPSDDWFTAFIGRKAGTEVEPLVRLDVVARRGSVHATIVHEDGSRGDTAAVGYDEGDDVATIVRKILAVLLQ
ncbi:hypothetical protein [Paraburkholderia sp. BL6669N2]|uniref:hypothetical protein n=1 Tax=Paraburkholderia sp. BL6669N2 TaxID=1938807 RepID=UPI0021611C5F|nr:hypothetical protein [Paraburkholderia sp. BL6669N2]